MLPKGILITYFGRVITLTFDVLTATVDHFVSMDHMDRLVAWHSGKMSVSDRQTFAVLRSTCG